MENKINIAELIKHCPQGTKLYSPLCGECYFDRLNMGTIICKKQNTQEITFTSEGYYMLPVFDGCECLLFPSKENRDWSKFQRPFKDGEIISNGNCICIYNGNEDDNYYGLYVGIGHIDFPNYFINIPQNSYFTKENARLATEEEKQKLFQAIKDNGYKWNPKTKTLEKVPKIKDGDIVYIKTSLSEWVSIFEKFDDDECKCYVNYCIDSDTYYGKIGGKKNPLCYIDEIVEQRLATEEEKQKLFDVIKENEHRWNSETKTLEKLVKPKFKVGDIITKIDGSRKGEIFYIDVDRYHVAVSNDIGIDVFFEDQDEWELIPDIKTKFGTASNPLEIKSNANCLIQERVDETKTEPKFKVGDVIQDIDAYKVKITEVNLEDECYEYESTFAKGIGSIPFSEQDNWELIYDTKPRFKVGDRIKNKHTCEIVTVKRVYELYYIVELNDTEMFLDRKLGEDYELVLVPDRFDINTLIPFESKVLVRDYVGKIWRPAFWGKYIEDSNCRYLTTNGCWVQCIPYEENKHLLGTTNDCIDFYKTW